MRLVDIRLHHHHSLQPPTTTKMGPWRMWILPRALLMHPFDYRVDVLLRSGRIFCQHPLHNAPRSRMKQCKRCNAPNRSSLGHRRGGLCGARHRRPWYERFFLFSLSHQVSCKYLSLSFLFLLLQTTTELQTTEYLLISFQPETRELKAKYNSLLNIISVNLLPCLAIVVAALTYP